MPAHLAATSSGDHHDAVDRLDDDSPQPPRNRRRTAHRCSFPTPASHALLSSRTPWTIPIFFDSS